MRPRSLSPFRSRPLRSAFTLVEMLLATILASILMAGVLVTTAALSRDRLRIETHEARTQTTAPLELIRRDLESAVAMVGASDARGFEAITFSAIDPQSLLPNQRLARVRYQIIQQGRQSVLIRDQAYLDDPVRVDRWSEIVAVGARRLTIVALSADDEPVRISDDITERLLAISRQKRAPSIARRAPSHLRVRLETTTGAVDREMVLR